MKHSPLDATLLPFRRRWHVIDELDLAPLLADHAAARQMCREVEALADRLADGPSLSDRDAVARLIRTSMLHHVRVTGAFFEHAFGGLSLRFGEGVLARILLGHVGDAIHAEDVIEALRIEPLEPARVDQLGYMLRCLFESCRRALAFEELALLTLMGDRLSSDARLALEYMLEQSARMD